MVVVVVVVGWFAPPPVKHREGGVVLWVWRVCFIISGETFPNRRNADNPLVIPFLLRLQLVPLEGGVVNPLY